MLALEEILSELSGGDVNEQGMPPGFRFHPTDEELITFYLASKVFNGTFCGIHIAEVDLNRCEPWELPDVAKMGEREWYFFSLRDRKYPTGLRTNRATGAGYWKATGKDREVYSTASNGNHAATLLGMKKTLVFYKGRAPRGEKTKWVMHEYRLDGDFSCRHTCKEEWVICRIFQKMGEKKNGVLLQGQRSHMQEVSNSFLSDQTNPCSKTGDLEIQPHKTMQSPHNQNQLMNHMLPESNIKSLINNLWSSSQPTATVAVSQANFQTNNVVLNNGSHQTSFSPTRNKEKEDTNHHHQQQQQQQMQSHSSFLLNTLLSHDQDYYHTTSLKEQEASHPKICKTEDSNFSHFKFSLSDHPVSDYDMRMIPQNLTTTSSYYQQKPLFFGNLDCGNVNRRNVMGNSGGEFTATDYEISSSASSSSGVVAAFNRPGFKQMLLDPPTKITAGESWPFPF